ncbi:hypothetical protein CWI49_09095, partial [Neisseria meningitidis]
HHPHRFQPVLPFRRTEQYSGLTKTSTALPRLAVLVFVNPLYQTKTNTRANSLTATRQSKCRLKQLGLSDGISFA